MVGVPFECLIIARKHENEFAFSHIQGGMPKGKRKAREMAKEHNLTPNGRWTTLRTQFRKGSGLHSSWESDATREYTDDSGEIVIITILCA